MNGVNVKDFIARVGEGLGIRSQEELAERLGVTPQTISKWVKGKQFPTHETEEKLLKMGMTVEELFGFPYRSSVKDMESEMKRKINYLANTLLANMDKI